MAAKQEIPSTTRQKPDIRRAVWLGWRRLCPHCGEAKLFESWFTLRPKCPVCGLRFEQRTGDTWAFWLIGDRVFIALLLLIIVLGLRSHTAMHVVTLFVVVVIPLVATMPHRLGVCVALDYLSRIWFGQASEVPDAWEPQPQVEVAGESRESDV